MVDIQVSKNNTPFELEQIRYDDDRTWKLISSGSSRGCFQMESQLVQNWLKRIKPKNLWELSAVIAIVRPGPLQSGFADDYVEYRSGKKTFESFGHHIIDEVFHVTDHVMIYQEQIMNLGTRLAWSHLDDKTRDIKVDTLRKGVGKKDQAKLLAIGKEFVEGCIANKVDQVIADKLFEIIKNCGRYAFNLAHSMSYAYRGYQTAYLKCHYPLQFYTTYLTYAKFKKKDKWLEIADLTVDSRVCGITIKGPNINSKNKHFKIERETNGDRYIRYGLSHMKYFGGKTMEFVEKLPEIRDWRQVIIATCSKEFNGNFHAPSAIALISTGAFSDTGVSRNSLLNAIRCIDRLSNKEREWVIAQLPTCQQIENLPKLITKCSEEVASKNRKEKVSSEAKVLNVNAYDDPAWIEDVENNYLGTAFTAVATDAKHHDAEHHCIDCYGDIPQHAHRRIAVIIDEVKYTITKKGKNPGQKMARVTVHDLSGNLLYLPVFPDLFTIVEALLVERNTVIMTLNRNQNGWVVESMEQL